MFKVLTTTSETLVWRAKRGKRGKSVSALIKELTDILRMAEYYGPNEKDSEFAVFGGLPRCHYLIEAGVMTPIVKPISDEPECDFYQVTSVDDVQIALNALKQLWIDVHQSGKVAKSVKVEKALV